MARTIPTKETLTIEFKSDLKNTAILIYSEMSLRLQTPKVVIYI